MKAKLIWLDWDELTPNQKQSAFNKFGKHKNHKRMEARYGVRDGVVIKAVYNIPLFNI